MKEFAWWFLPKFMAIVPWGFFHWIGLVVQFAGLIGMGICWRREFGTLKFWRWS